MNHLDLFSGIGGFALAAERAGFETVQFVEIEPFCQSVLQKNFPGVPVHGDISTFCGERFRGRVDLLTGGFPCQDISGAGKGAGIEGKRSGLWTEMYRVIRECRPAFCLIENVPMLRTRGADRVLGDLERAGYTAGSFVVGADDIGATHRRKRVWIVAHSLQSGLASLPESRGEARSREPHGWATSISASGGNVAYSASAELEGNQSGIRGEDAGRESHRHAERESGTDLARPGNEDVAYADELNGRRELSQPGMREQRTRTECERDGRNLPLFPPARNDFRGWAAVASLDASLMPCAERDVRNLADGLPSRLVRRRRTAILKGLGNAIVPPVAEIFCRWIYQQLVESGEVQYV